jgi:hypothetical protein
MAYPKIEEMVQKKVTELIAKYSEFKVGLNTCYLSKIEAKQCALILCDEILNDGKMMYSGGGISDVHYKFWESVKASLNAL